MLQKNALRWKRKTERKFCDFIGECRQSLAGGCDWLHCGLYLEYFFFVFFCFFLNVNFIKLSISSGFLVHRQRIFSKRGLVLQPVGLHRTQGSHRCPPRLLMYDVWGEYQGQVKALILHSQGAVMITIKQLGGDYGLQKLFGTFGAIIWGPVMLLIVNPIVLTHLSYMYL